MKLNISNLLTLARIIVIPIIVICIYMNSPFYGWTAFVLFCLASITDYFVIATGTSEPHVRAIWTEVADSIKQKHGVVVGKPEGIRNNKWVVLDYFDVIMHVMVKDIRDEYDLEGLWNDAPQVIAETVA